MPNSSKNQFHTRETLRLYLSTAFKYRREAWLSIALPLSNIVLGVLMPLFASRVLAGLITQGPGLWRDFYTFVAFTGLGIILNYVGIRAHMKLQAKTLRDLHMLVFNRLLERSVGFYSNRVGGKLVSDATAFVSSFLQLANAGFETALSFTATTLVGLVIIFFSNWVIGLCLLILIIVLTVWTFFDSKRRSHLRASRLIISRNLTAHLSDNIVNAVTVKTFAREKEERHEAQHLSEKLREARMNDWTKTVGIETQRMSLLLITQVLIIFVLIRLTADNPALLATGIFAFTYTITLINKFFSINTLVRQIEEVFLQASPMTEILMEENEIIDVPHAPELVVSKGAIQLDHVSFRYADAPMGQNIFTGLNLDIKPGEKIGLVGHSGGGKSTLTRLLLRFDDIISGSIKIDGMNIAEVTQTSLRKSISYVPQEPLLFHRSIKENIAYSKPDASDKEIEQAARSAYAHDFIEALPDKYETVVGERGVKLSGGQRQRIAIARAILKDAPILILDEATSALDSESEQLIQDALWNLIDKRTAVIIAHRLSTIQRMDRILVIEAGEIIEQGSHKKLVEQNGLYAHLWKRQSGGFIEE